ncbi:TetR family transcriptional regulator [Lentzea sp. NBRC 105346]|uniref:TetR/AcrR family transcriptional regulator n=1 Tax=Lentzea sp. NBRC 105346 TaxID=3032205 RepID=UPI0024A43C97|nr:TetR/AcrR family transcriptional regulator [Lentzea sp. NBRC 105346]GLZ30027.1 TetR family transcriptional regulator [Lentzea sp. NBRC 105346]
MEEVVKPRRAYNTSLRAEQARQTRRRIAEAARRLFVARGYHVVTMAEIAAEAGVAYQTVYAVFGNKKRVAHEIIWTTFDVEGVHHLIAEATAAPDPETWLRSAAHISQVVNERLGELLRFLQESGDPELQAEHRDVESRRRDQQQHFAELLAGSGRLTPGLSEQEALDVLWTMTGSHLYQELVVRQGWSAQRYEEWLGDALIGLLLSRGA